MIHLGIGAPAVLKGTLLCFSSEMLCLSRWTGFCPEWAGWSWAQQDGGVVLPAGTWLFVSGKAKLASACFVPELPSNASCSPL